MTILDHFPVNTIKIPKYPYKKSIIQVDPIKFDALPFLDTIQLDGQVQEL